MNPFRGREVEHNELQRRLRLVRNRRKESSRRGGRRLKRELKRVPIWTAKEVERILAKLRAEGVIPDEGQERSAAAGGVA